ncbi:protein TAPETUM DETERMINANT 1-like [Oryza brachyantha]|uniref:protein TAPETUM DETERMINANT 1-like n=1 Tax=Oryza brachyantha TaxID=4533 RepID=UPI001ADD2032|nr:protein TAPETUM DETERMINANT 1-like [Oryza brachyantha]
MPSHSHSLTAMARAAFVFSLLLASVCNATAQGAGEVAAACRATDLVVRQRATGRVVEGKPEYAVEVANRCRCAQSRVLLRCYGLSSVESVDPRAIRPVDDDRCVLRGGRPIRRGAPPVRFTYAWMTPFDFPLVSSQVHC